MPATPPAASATSPLPGAPPGAPPAVGLPGVPNPFDLLSGLDPRQWAGDILDGVVSAIGRALIEVVRSFIDWALGFGNS